MPQTCKVCASGHRDEIEEQFKNGIPSRVIAKFVKANFGEDISHVAISNHVKSHLNSDEKSKIVERLEAVIEALDARIRNLERYNCHHASTAQCTGWRSYSKEGMVSHAISHRDILEDAIPDAETLDADYSDLVQSLLTRQKTESGLPLNDDEFVKQRADDLKAEEEARIVEEEATKNRMQAAAREEIERIESERISRMESLERLAKKQERQSRLQALRDEALEKAAGIDEEGNQLVDV